MNQEIIAYNLKNIRLTKGLNQSTVAEQSNISRTAYRNIENGSSVPKISTLQSICKTLGIKIQDLLLPISPLKEVRFRAKKRLNTRDYILTEVSRWLRDFNFLEELLDEKLKFKFKELAKELNKLPPGQERAIFAAKRVREYLDLSEREPIRDIAGILESCGIKVYPISIASDGFFGLSVSENDGGPAIVVNVWDRISVERWIFSAAHELGHLLLHLNSFDVSESEENEDQEDEANQFAGYFLMPDEGFQAEWNEAYGLPFVDRVLKVKRIFKVSYRTVLYRLSEQDSVGPSIWKKFQFAYMSKTGGKSLKKTDEPDALSPNDFKETMSEIFRSQEPDSLSDSDFIEDRLSRLVRLAIEQEKITLSRGGEILRLDTEAMRERVASWVI